VPDVPLLYFISIVYHLLPKVTETLVQPYAQSAVNVSSSAQAISIYQKWCYVVQLFVITVKTVPR